VLLSGFLPEYVDGGALAALADAATQPCAGASPDQEHDLSAAFLVKEDGEDQRSGRGGGALGLASSAAFAKGAAVAPLARGDGARQGRAAGQPITRSAREDGGKSIEPGPGGRVGG
jgi:hypothetical protein